MKTLRKVLSAVIARFEAFLLNPLATRRDRWTLGLVILSVFLGLWLTQTDRVLLWAQTVAGNWSPPAPPPSPPGTGAAAAVFGNFEISLTGTLAIILNIGALGLLLKTMIHVIQLQRRQLVEDFKLTSLISMDKTALHNDIVTAFDEIFDLNDTMKNKLTDIVNEKFAAHKNTIDVNRLKELLDPNVVEKIESGLRSVQFDRSTGAPKIG